MSRERKRMRLGPSPEREAGANPDDSQYHDGSFHRYMENKNRKLAEQFDAAAEAAAAYAGIDESKRTLFQGVAIHVNGLTVPSHLELKQLMVLYGGVFENYYYRDKVTHIICSNLTDQKVKNFDRERNPTPVVRPEWVVDSIKAGHRLPIQDYVLQRLRDAPGQRMLRSFQAVESRAALPAAELYPELQGADHSNGRPHRSDVDPAACSPALITSGSKPADDNASNTAAAPAERLKPLFDDEAQVAAADAATRVSSHAAAMDPQRPPEAASSGGAGRSASEQPEDTALDPRESYGTVAAQHAPQVPVPAQGNGPGEAGGGGSARSAQQVAAAKRAACDLLRGPPRSSKEDPNFVDTYFRASRLHFIGTWKARIEALAISLAGSAPAPAGYQAKSGAGLLHQPCSTTRPAQRAVVHLDMDCFFASVAALSDPSLKGKPLAVCHSNSGKGTAEVSSANYEARKFGIRAGSFMADAKRRCPDLVVMPYEFEKYETISEQVYRIMLQHTAAVQPLSCDEAFLDVTGLGEPQAIVAAMRSQIEAKTGCAASAGIGPNMLLARLATKRAKPNGQCLIRQEDAEELLMGLAVDALPGVGWSNAQKLEGLGIKSVADVRGSSRERLQRDLGLKTGELLWQYAHGQDDRPVEPPKPRRSVGAEVNWGVRFEKEEDAVKFLRTVAEEVAGRLREAGLRGRTMTLKLKRRKAGAPEASKFLGHGICDNHSRSVTLARFTDSAADIAEQALALLRALRIPADQIRGVGITMTRLDNDPASAAARPGAPVAAKGAAPPATTFDGNLPAYWTSFAALPEVQQAMREQEEAQARQPQGDAQPSQPPSPAQPPSEKQPQQQHQADHDCQVMLADGAQAASPAGQTAAASGGTGSRASPATVALRRPGALAALASPPGKQVTLAEALQRRQAHPSPSASSPAEGTGPSHKAPPSSGGKLGGQHSQLVCRTLFNGAVSDGHPNGISAPGAPDPSAQSEAEQLYALKGKARAEDQQREAVVGCPPDPLPPVQALALSQVDAEVFQALPHHVQKELINTLPRTASAAPPQPHPSSAAAHQQPRPHAAAGVGAQARPATSSRSNNSSRPAGSGGGGGAVSTQSAPAALRVWGRDADSRDSINSRESVEALPPVSQLDPSVLDALPLPLRRELERAYGIGVGSPTRNMKRRRGGAAHTSKSGRPARRQPGLDFPVVPPRAAAAGLTMTQVDLRVLAELPPEVQREINASLAASGSGRRLGAAMGYLEAISEEGEGPTESGTGRGEQLQELRELVPPELQGVFDAGSALAGWRVLQQWIEQRTAEFTAAAKGNAAAGPDDGAAEQSRAATGLPAEQVDAIVELILRWGQLLVEHDLEGLHAVLRRIQALQHSHAAFSMGCTAAVAILQKAVKDKYGCVLHLPQL